LVIGVLLSLQPVFSLGLDLVRGDLLELWPLPEFDQPVELVEVQHYVVVARPLPVGLGIALEREADLTVTEHDQSDPGSVTVGVIELGDLVLGGEPVGAHGPVAGSAPGACLKQDVFVEISPTVPQPLVVFFPPARDEHDPAACCAEDPA
jgi:hypothetical protein